MRDNDTLPKNGKGISVRMYQLFYNLIGNALKFQKLGNKSIMSISMQADSEIVVKDNDVGFDQQHADKIL